MTTPYRVTPRAAADLNHIAVYSLRKWGRRQTIAYLEALDDRFAWLAEYPDIGRARPDILPELRSFREGSQIIFYRARGTIIEIIGVPHMSMDLDSYFESER